MRPVLPANLLDATRNLAKDKVLMGSERRSMIISDDEKRVTAIHEAGHAQHLGLLGGVRADMPADERAMVFERVKRVNPAAEVILYLYTPVPLAGELYEQERVRRCRSLEDGRSCQAHRCVGAR